MNLAEDDITILKEDDLILSQSRKSKSVLEKTAVNLFNKIGKRLLDLLAGIVGMIMLIPITTIVAIANFFEKDKGPIFFIQERIGKDGKLFKMYKFRTMIVGADKELERILKEDKEAAKEYKKNKKLKNDPRVTRIGKFLRKTSLDEFPQFINVLKGDMSLVGPRPYLPREQEDMGEFYYYIIKCKPGITGLWQVSGRSEVSFNERLELDLQYCKNTNVIQDVGLVAKTVIKTIKREGAA